MANPRPIQIPVEDEPYHQRDAIKSGMKGAAAGGVVRRRARFEHRRRAVVAAEGAKGRAVARSRGVEDARRLGARVDCRRLWEGVVDGYEFD